MNKKCDLCGFIGQEDPIKGCPRCGWDEMKEYDACTLCLKAEGLQFPDMKAIYCEPCYNAKKESWGVVHEIIPGLFLSGMKEAETWTGGTRLCVHEDTPTYEGGLHVPILSKKPNSFKDRRGAIADEYALYEVAGIIEAHQKAGVPILVHCWGGVERSPWRLHGTWLYTVTERISTPLTCT